MGETEVKKAVAAAEKVVDIKAPKVPPQRNILLSLAAAAELWKTDAGVAFATLPCGDHHENRRVRSQAFTDWLAYRYYKKTSAAAGGDAFGDAVRSLHAQAIHEGPIYPAPVRVARHEKNIYLDLADEKWRAVEITAGSWRVVDESPVHFQRPRGVLPLPEPEAGGSLDDLRPFINTTDSDFRLACAWLLGAMCPEGPFPILVIAGEQGSAKSTTSRVLRALIDPSIAPIRTAPREERDALVAANNGWVIALDNLSTMPAWLADALARLATGGGFSTRQLHTDTEEILFEAKRPIILNGIADLATRPDLADRALALSLPNIEPSARRLESEFWAEFEQARAFILGGLCDAVAAALDQPTPPAPKDGYPRMADFAAFAVAAEIGKGFPWAEGGFMEAYTSARVGLISAAIEDDPVAAALLAFAEALARGEETHLAGTSAGGWEGTATELLEILREQAGEKVSGSKFFPQAPNALTARLRRIAPPLRERGAEVWIGRVGKNRRRTIHVAMKAQQGEEGR